MQEWIDNILGWIAGATGGTIFIGIGILGAVLLLLALIFDSIFDFDDGPFSLTSIGAFLGAFGYSALIAKSLGFSMSVAAIIGGVVGIISWVGAWQIVRMMRGKEPNSITMITSDGSNKLSTDVAGNLSTVMDAVKSATGIYLADIISTRVTAKAAGETFGDTLGQSAKQSTIQPSAADNA